MQDLHYCSPLVGWHLFRICFFVSYCNLLECSLDSRCTLILMATCTSHFRLHYLMNGGDVCSSVVNPRVNSKFFPNIPLSSREKTASCRVCWIIQSCVTFYFIITKIKLLLIVKMQIIVHYFNHLQVCQRAPCLWSNMPQNKLHYNILYIQMYIVHNWPFVSNHLKI